MGVTRPHPARTLRAPATRLAGLVLILGAVALAGCGKKDKITQPVVPPRYPALSTPQNVMIALATAYSSRDSVEYALLFDDNYVGTSTDQSLPSPQTLTFTKADEVAHIAALARSRTIFSVSLSFNPTLVRSTDPSDPVGWATIQITYINLEINDAITFWSVSPSGEYMEFKFKPTPVPASPTDTTWQIAAWTEFYNP